MAKKPTPRKSRSSPRQRSAYLRSIGLVAAAALLTAVLAYVLWGALAAEKSGRTPEPEQTLALAPDVSLVATQGRFSLSDHRGNVVLLYFSFPG